MLKHLVSFLRRGGLPNVDYNLLLELMITGLNANGFSESQRWELVKAAEYTGQEVRISPLAQWWPWEALNRKAGTEEDVVKVNIASLLCGFRVGSRRFAYSIQPLCSLSFPPIINIWARNRLTLRSQLTIISTTPTS